MKNFNVSKLNLKELDHINMTEWHKPEYLNGITTYFRNYK